MLTGRANDNLKVAFNAGSSKHGSARRASVAWNCVAATHLMKAQKKNMKYVSSKSKMVREFECSPGCVAHFIRTSIESLQQIIQHARVFDINVIQIATLQLLI